MKSKIFRFAIIAAAIGGCFLWNSCGGDDEEEQCTEETVEEAVAVTQPSLVKVYIDASGSMQGYFGHGDVQPISQALTNIERVPVDYNVEYAVWNSKTPLNRENLSKSLIGGLKGGASPFHDIMKRMVEESSDTALTVLLTDGILSSSAADTHKYGIGYTDVEKESLKMDIEKILGKSSGKAVSIYRMEGHFNGTYYDKGNKTHKYNNLRPFFLVVLGEPANVRYFDQEARKGNIHEVYTKAEALHIGTAPENLPFQIEPTGDGDDQAKIADGFAIAETRENCTMTYSYIGELGIKFAGKLPQWLVDNYDASTIKSMSEVIVEGKPVNVRINIEGKQLSFVVPENIIHNQLNVGEEYDITYRMKDPVDGAWDKYSTADDTYPDSISTYLLKDFVEAVNKGVRGNDKKYLLDSSVSIKPYTE